MKINIVLYELGYFTLKMNYQISYESDSVFDKLRNIKIHGQLIDMDWIKTQVYNKEFVIPEMFPRIIPSLESILRKLRCSTSFCP